MALGIVVVGIDPHHGRHGVFGHGGALLLDFERCGDHHLFGSGFQMPADRPLGMIRGQCGIQELPRRVNYQTHPVLAPVDRLGRPLGSQQAHGDAVDDHGSGAVVDVADHGWGLVAMQIGMQGTVGGIALQVMGDVRQAGTGLAADIDHDFVEIAPPHMVPHGQFTDAAQSVHPNVHLPFVH